MKNITYLVERIQNSDMSDSDKNMLVAILAEEKTDYTSFILTLLKTLGVAKDVLEKFDLDIGELIDKIL